jgi:hypothetical protein
LKKIKRNRNRVTVNRTTDGYQGLTDAIFFVKEKNKITIEEEKNSMPFIETRASCKT